LTSVIRRLVARRRQQVLDTSLRTSLASLREPALAATA
jgi:hypothetical protein